MWPITKYGKKIYIRIPYGEIQYGINTRSIYLWFKGKCYKVKKPNYKRAKPIWLANRKIDESN